MDKILAYFKGRSVGFYITLASILFSILAAILLVGFNGGGDGTYANMMSWSSFALLLVGAAASIVLVVLKKENYAPITTSILSLVALCLYIYQTYLYLSACLVGIDSQFSASYILIIVFMLIAIITGYVALCLSLPLTAHLYKTKKGLITGTSALLCVLVTGTIIANENEVQINSVLNINTSYFENSDGEKGPNYYDTSFNNLEQLIAAGQAKGEEAMGEGLVLLKNEEVNGQKALPLAEGHRNITFFGVGSVDPVYGGTGSGAVDTSTAPTFKSAFERDGLFSVNPTLWDYYNGCSYKRVLENNGAGTQGVTVIGEAPFNEVKTQLGNTYQQYGDAAVVVLSRVGGEGADVPLAGHTIGQLKDSTGSQGDSTNGDYLTLSPKEIDLLKGLKQMKDAGQIKEIVVLLNTTNQIEANFVKDDSYGIDAAMWIGTPGQTGLYAVAEALAGNINPSGRLSDTFWANHEANPSLANFGAYTYEGAPSDVAAMDKSYVVYQEGIYVGYLYTETRYADYVIQRANVGDFDYDYAVAYPFGYGLSYSNFTYSDFKVEEGETADGEKAYVVSVKVTNDSEVAGKHTVEVYLQKPYGEYNIQNGVEAAAVELVGFDKTAEIPANGSTTVTIEIPERSFASYDANSAKTYVLTPGDYYLAVGSDSHDALNNILAFEEYTPSTTSNRMDAEGDSTLATKVLSQDALDKTTYAKSEATGADITNQFGFADWNQYANKGDTTVDYVTRNNWSGTLPSDIEDHVVLPWSQQLENDMNKYGKEGEVKLPEDNSEYPVYGSTDTDYKLIELLQDENGDPIPYNDPKWDDLLDQLTWDEQVDLVRYGMRNTGEIGSIDKPATVDQNGPSGLTEAYYIGKNGFATKTKDPLRQSKPMCYPAGGVLAATFNKELMYEVGDMIGEDALWAGYNGLYGPGSNIHRTPYSGRNFEYYSEDGYLSGIICGYECSGMEANGLYVYNKHIGLNDQEDQRRGISVWANEQSIRELYMRAFDLPITMEGTQFQYGDETITLKGASGVMTAFNRMGLYWSSMNEGLMTNFLRDECGMRGIAVTDMWTSGASPYMNLAAMLVAGTNIVDGQRPASDLDACKSNHADVAWAMRESTHRILYTVVHSNAMNGVSVGTGMVTVTPWWKILLITLDSVFGAALAGVVVWLVIDEVRKKRSNSVQ